MAEKIVVPLKSSDGINEVIPYIEKIAEPGMKVVFIIHYPVDGFDWLQARSGTMESGIQSAVRIQRMVAWYTWERQSQLVNEKVSFAREALCKRGVEVAVELCTESFRKAVRSYMLKGDVHLIMRRAGIGLRIKRFLQGTIAAFGLFKRPSFSPVLLVHPGTLL